MGNVRALGAFVGVLRFWPQLSLGRSTRKLAGAVFSPLRHLP
jgi:hypothetical protein